MSGVKPRRYALTAWRRLRYRSSDFEDSFLLEELFDFFLQRKPYPKAVETPKRDLPVWAPFTFTLGTRERVRIENRKSWPEEEAAAVTASCLVLDYDGGTAPWGLADVDTPGLLIPDDDDNETEDVGGNDKNTGGDDNRSKSSSPSVKAGDTPQGLAPTPPPPGHLSAELRRCRPLAHCPGPDVGDLECVWGEFVCLLHTTWSHESVSPRSRAIIPLRRDVTAEEYDKLHRWAELRSADAGFRVDPGGRRLGRRWVPPNVVRRGRHPRIVVIDEGDGVCVFNPDTALILAEAHNHAPYSCAAPACSDTLKGDEAVHVQRQVLTVKAWAEAHECGDTEQCFCPQVERSSLGSAWLRRYRSGVAVFCTSANHGHVVPLRLWWEDASQGQLVCRPDVALLDKLVWRRVRGTRQWPPKSTVSNFDVILSQDQRLRGKMWFDSFTWSVYLGDNPIEDAKETELGLWLERHYGLNAVSDAFRRAHYMVAKRKERDQLTEWVLEQKPKGFGDNGVDWAAIPLGAVAYDQGPSLLDQWLVKGLGSIDTPIVRTFGRRWLIQAVARVFEPGVKADNVLVFTGRQGFGKSEALNILCGGDLHRQSPLFANTELQHLGSMNAAAQIRGTWIYEIAEFAGMRAREVEEVKAFVTLREDRHRLAYLRHAVSIKRRTVFCCTTNDEEFLRDPTGNRRYWPVVIEREPDWDWLAEHRSALWYHTVVAYKRGETYHVPREEWESVAEHTAAFEEEVPWGATIAMWLQREAPPVFTTAFLAQVALGFHVRAINKGVVGQIGRIMKGQPGWSRVRLSIGGTQIRVYAKAEMASSAIRAFIDEKYESPSEFLLGSILGDEDDIPAM